MVGGAGMEGLPRVQTTRQFWCNWYLHAQCQHRTHPMPTTCCLLLRNVFLGKYRATHRQFAKYAAMYQWSASNQLMHCPINWTLKALSLPSTISSATISYNSPHALAPLCKLCCWVTAAK